MAETLSPLLPKERSFIAFTVRQELTSGNTFRNTQTYFP
jgi:hypothetical protein